MHQRAYLADLACIADRLLTVSKRGLGITKKPKGPRAIVERCDPSILAKSTRQRNISDRLIKRDRAIKIRSPFYEIARPYQGNAHSAMPDHERDCCSLLISKRQELRRKVKRHFGVERQ